MNRLIAGGLMMAGALFGGAANAAGPIHISHERIVVIYYSWSPDGNTRFAAETIARKADCKVFEIKAKQPYSTDFRTCCNESKQECYGKQLRPIEPIEGLDFSMYDVIFIGTPNWWGTMAPPVRTFVTENADAMKGKVVCLFQTNGGGGMQRCGTEFAELLPDCHVLPARAFDGRTIRDRIAELERFVIDRVFLK